MDQSAPTPTNLATSMRDPRMVQARIGAATTTMTGAGPELLQAGARRMAQSSNPVVSGIGKVAEIPANFIAPSESDKQAATRVIQNNANPQDIQRMGDKGTVPVLGIASPLSTQKVTSILPRMSGEDYNWMTDLIDLVRTKKIGGVRPTPEQAKETEILARYVAEGMGINPDQKNGALIKAFEQILQRVK